MERDCGIGDGIGGDGECMERGFIKNIFIFVICYIIV